MELLKNDTNSKRLVISYINNLFGVDDDDFLYLFLSHRFDVQKQEYVITNKRIPNRDLKIVIPQLHKNIEEALKIFNLNM